MPCKLYWLDLCWNIACLNVVSYGFLNFWTRWDRQQHGNFKYLFLIAERWCEYWPPEATELNVAPRPPKRPTIPQIRTFELVRRKAKVNECWKILPLEPETFGTEDKARKYTGRKISASLSHIISKGEGKIDGERGQQDALCDINSPSLPVLRLPGRQHVNLLTVNEAWRYLTSTLAPREVCCEAVAGERDELTAYGHSADSYSERIVIQ
jgi:hypothetical protein